MTILSYLKPIIREYIMIKLIDRLGLDQESLESDIVDHSLLRLPRQHNASTLI